MKRGSRQPALSLCHMKTHGEGGHQHPRKTALPRTGPEHRGLGLPASRAVRKLISVAEAPQPVVFCEGSLSGQRQPFTQLSWNVMVLKISGLHVWRRTRRAVSGSGMLGELCVSQTKEAQKSLPAAFSLSQKS